MCLRMRILYSIFLLLLRGDSSVGIATRYGLDGPGIPVSERSKARVFGRSLARVAGLYPAGIMDVCVVCVVQ